MPGWRWLLRIMSNNTVDRRSDVRSTQLLWSHEQQLLLELFTTKELWEPRCAVKLNSQVLGIVTHMLRFSLRCGSQNLRPIGGQRSAVIRILFSMFFRSASNQRHCWGHGNVKKAIFAILILFWDRWYFMLGCSQNNMAKSVIKSLLLMTTYNTDKHIAADWWKPFRSKTT